MNIKKILIISVFALIATSLSLFSVYGFPGGGTIDGPSLERGLVGHWKLDSQYGAKDATPYSNHGTGGGGVTIGGATDRMGQANMATSFDGVDNHIIIPHSSIFEENHAYSFSFWIKPTNYSSMVTAANIISKRSATSNGFFFYILRTTKELTVDFGGSYTRWSTGYIVPENEFHNLTLVLETNNVKLYVDGDLYSSSTINGDSSLLVSGADIGIGKELFLELYKYSGVIDDVRIYNRALSQEEISLLYDSYKPQLQVSSLNKGLVGHWTLDQDRYNPSNNRVADLTPYGNHGTNYGATFTTDRFGKTGGAMSFNGSTKITAPYQISSITDNDHTIVAWIKTDRNLGTANLDRLTIFKDTTAWSPGIWFHGSTIRAHTNGKYTDITWNQDNEWHQIGQVYNASTNDLKIILDGNIISGSSTNYSATPSGVLEIANNPGASTVSPFEGFMDDVRIYNRALSEQEISQLYSSYKPKITPDLQNGLVLDMPLTSTYTKSSTPGSEIMTDRTPYSNDGQNIGATITGDGAEFNGSSSGITINNFPLMFNNSISLSVWAYYNDDTRGVIFGNYNSFNDINFEKHTSRRLRLYWNRGERDVFSSVNAFELNQWSHIVIIRNKELNRMEFWVNGELINTVLNAGSDITSTNQTFRIGRDSRTGITVTDGKLSNMKIYNHALSPEEISLLYSRGR